MDLGSSSTTSSPAGGRSEGLLTAIADTAHVHGQLDLPAHDPVDGYTIRERHYEQIRLRDRTCAFPDLPRPAPTPPGRPTHPTGSHHAPHPGRPTRSRGRRHVSATNPPSV